MKGKRQERILEIIKENIIFTQDDLQNILNSLGFKVTQSTVSRDIKELRLVKGHDQNGNYRYISSDARINEYQPLTHYRNIFSRSVVSVDNALNDIVVKCYNGMASSVCVAIDAMYGSRMLGSIAGDDTIFIVTRSTNDAISLAEEFKKMM